MFNLSHETLWQKWAPLPLRLIIGYGFLAHGWAKLSRGPEGFARLLEQIGTPLPGVMAWVSTFTEIVGGLAILAGAFVAAASVPLIVMMLVAMFTVHLRYGFSAINTISGTARCRGGGSAPSWSTSRSTSTPTRPWSRWPRRPV
jgi:putative oxidoreductase